MTDSDIDEKVRNGSSNGLLPDQPLGMITLMKMTGKQFALGVSIVFHVILLLVLFVWYLPQETGRSASTAVVPPDTQRNAPQRAAESTPQVPESLEKLAAEQPDVSAEEVQKSVESQIDRVQQIPDAKKLTELEKNLQRLQSIANQQSVEQVSSTIAESLGLDATEYAPKEAPVAGALDTNTAQIADIVRTQDAKGNWQYESVMVDAEGRQMTVPLGADDGARLYETFELMKRYPMAKGVYQSVVMPMLQKMLEADSAAQPSGP